MRSRYDPDHPHHPHADAWPGERWLADWWRALTGGRRCLAGAGAVLAVVAALVGLAVAGDFARDPAGASATLSGALHRNGVPGRSPGRPGQVPGRLGRRPASLATRVSPARPRTSCQSVAHIGDSTSADLISPASVPDPAQRLAAQYSDVGVRNVRIDASGGRSIVEALPGQVNGFNVARAWSDGGYRGCWVFALGTNDVANVAAGSNIGLQARIQQMMAQAHGQPVMWVSTRTLLSGGPWAQANQEAWDGLLDKDLAAYPNLRVFNWAAVAQPGWFLPDGIHYNPAGCAVRARDIALALALAFPAGGHSASRIVT
jgi:hypothetical protein